MVRKPVVVMIGLLLVGCLALAGAARADWNPGDPFKWLQPPDLTNTGVDVQVNYYRTLADDFLCTESGPITDIHIWGSFKSDLVPPLPFPIRLGIWTNVPDGGQGFSTPGTRVWDKTFYAGDYTSRQYATVSQGEYFWDPVSGDQGSDTKVYQFNFFINPAQAFSQVLGTTYWLSVHAQLDPALYPFGWKTSLQHWMDDAVYRASGSDPWQELTYFTGHPLAGQSMDLAFVMTTVPVPGSLLLLGSGLLGLAVGWRRRFQT